jgi:hypothetical protein
MPDKDSLTNLVVAQNTALFQTAATISAMKETMAAMASNQVELAKQLESHTTAVNSFMGNTLKIVVVIFAILLFVIGGLLTALNVRGGDKIQSAVSTVVSSGAYGD